MPSALLEAHRSLLVVVDLQPRLLDLAVRPSMVRESTRRLLEFADLFGVPVLLTEQYPEGLGPTDPELLARFDELEVPHQRLSKNAFGCCEEPRFAAALEALGAGESPRDQVVLAGIEAHVCVLQTAFGLLEQGLQVHGCWDAISGRGEEYRHHGLRRMEQAGVQISNHESVAFEWARDKQHPSFKKMQQELRKGQPE